MEMETETKKGGLEATIIMQLQPEVLFIDGSPHKDLGLGLGLNFGFGLAMQTTFTSAT